MGVVDFTKARRLVKFQKPTGFQTLPVLGRLQNLLLPLYFRGNVSLPFAYLFLLKEGLFHEEGGGQGSSAYRVGWAMDFLSCGYKIFVFYIIMLPTKNGHNFRE